MITSTPTPLTIQPPPKYPYLGEWTHSTTKQTTIVLFTEPRSGMCLYASDPNDTDHPGRTTDNWAEEQFVPYVGSLVLSNV